MLKRYHHYQQYRLDIGGFYIFLCLITLLRLIYVLTVHRPVNVDEAQYWLWSQHLSWGYHSKPPLIAAVIWLTSHLFGNGYFGLRFAAPIAYFVASLFIYLAAKRLFSVMVGRWSAITFILLPSVSFSATIINTDPFMLMFWAIALYFFILAWQSERLWCWLLMAVAVGLSALAKYTGLLFLLCLLLFLIVDRPSRRYFCSISFYLSLLLVVLVLLPNIIWNIHHGMETVHNIAGHNIIGSKGIDLRFSNLPGFLVNQLGIFSVILFPCYLVYLFSRQYWKTSSQRLLWCFSFPILLLILLESLFSHAIANWSAAAYISATILVTFLLSKQSMIKWLKTNLLLSVIAFLSMSIIDVSVLQGWLRFHHYSHFYRKTLGWQYIGSAIETIKQDYPNANFIFNNRAIWAKSVYYGDISLSKVYVWNPQSQRLALDSWNSPSLGQDFIYLSDDGKLPVSMTMHFEQTRSIKVIPIEQFGKRFSTVYVYYLAYFKG